MGGGVSRWLHSGSRSSSPNAAAADVRLGMAADHELGADERQKDQSWECLGRSHLSWSLFFAWLLRSSLCLSVVLCSTQTQLEVYK